MIKFLKKIARGILILVGMRERTVENPTNETPVAKRSAPNESEQRYIDNFRTDIKALPAFTESSKNSATEKKWIDRQKKLRENILTKDPRDFFTWEEIKYSMLGQYVPHELDFIKKSPTWPVWKKALEEIEFCELNTSWDLPFESRTTVIGNAFKLSQLIINQRINLKEIDTILEFGGGYGSITRLCYRLGFKGTYIIFDLPEFSALQKYFLSASELPVKIESTPTESHENTVVLLSKISQLKEQLKYTAPDIFIATWSLSESPMPLRNIIVDLIKDTKYYLLAYQKQFPILTGVDNVAYFKQLQNDLGNRDWVTYPFKLHPNDFFLISKKKD